MQHLEDYQRYGRQMILDGFGLQGQLKLQRSSVIVVGAGGLGCPALQYLAAAGVGRIGIMDHDVVEMSNLSRQILHLEKRLGEQKAISAAEAIKDLNSRVQVDTLTEYLVPSNAVSILKHYDLILDCTDNLPTRYLLSDCAVVLHKPLISGAAQRYEGQLCTYNLGKNGPCFRCLFPTAPTLKTTGTCDETGILGAVTGIIGNLQALEAVKILAGVGDPQPYLLLYSAISPSPFRSIKLRSRKADCSACRPDALSESAILKTDYVLFCAGSQPHWKQEDTAHGDNGQRIRAFELKDLLVVNSQLVIVDVRPEVEFGICKLPGSINVPLLEFMAHPLSHLPSGQETVIVCRRGNDSLTAASAVRDLMPGAAVKDLVGGLRAWSEEVDHNFPVY